MWNTEPKAWHTTSVSCKHDLITVEFYSSREGCGELWVQQGTLGANEQPSLENIQVLGL